MTLEADRQYLAQLAAAGDWRPQKAIGDYKADQITRKARQFRKQQSLGLPISNQAARGHVFTKEHPERKGLPKQPAPAQAYTSDPSKYKPKIKPVAKRGRRFVHRRPPYSEEVQTAHGVLRTTPDMAELLGWLEGAAAGRQRVILRVYDCSTKTWYELFANVGHSLGMRADALLEEWRESGQSLHDWLLGLIGDYDFRQSWLMTQLGRPSHVGAGAADHLCLFELFVIRAAARLA